MIFAVDPGPRRSGWVLYDPERKRVAAADGDYPNEGVRTVARSLSAADGDVVVVEEVLPFASAGRDIANSIRFIGRLEEIADALGLPCHVYTYAKVRTFLTDNHRAKESQVRAAVLDRFGGSDSKAKGTEKNPGPCFGVTSHAWSALALAVYHAEVGQ